MQIVHFHLFNDVAKHNPAAMSLLAPRLDAAISGIRSQAVPEGVLQMHFVKLCGVLCCHLPAVDAKPHMSRMVQLAEEASHLAPATSGSLENVNLVFPEFVQQLRVVLVKNPDVIDEAVVECVQKYAKSSDPWTRDYSEDFLRHRKGITLTTVAEAVERHDIEIDGLNAKIKSTCKDVESLRVYMDQNTAELKAFLAQVVKRLPVPCSFDVQRKFVVRKTIRLHFACGRALENCSYPGGSAAGDTFIIEA